MNLSRLLLEREAQARPVRLALIGAGKFGRMFLAQARRTPGMHVVAVADIDVERAREAMQETGWAAEQVETSSVESALSRGTTYIGEDALGIIGCEQLDVVVEATGLPEAGIRHCSAAIESGHHVVMVNVEADVIAGPLLAREARAAGVVYSLAWGDQPALICEHVDWARACGFEVVCAGKGTRYLPAYHQLNPDTVWEVLSEYLEISDPESINLKMFNSFLDGTKSGIEMTAVCNATGLKPQPDGLGFPPASRFELAEVCRPKNAGGTLEAYGTTEVVSSLNRNGDPVTHHLAMGTFVVVKAGHPYARQCFREYHMLQDSSGEYAALYRPIHLIGMELGISVASAALRGEPTGAPVGFFSDVVATTKRAMRAGDILDGEGGFTVWGKQVPARVSLDAELLPLGLAHGVKLLHDVEPGQMLKWSDVELKESDIAVAARRRMEAAFDPR